MTDITPDKIRQQIAVENANRRSVRIWLYTICILVFLIVLVGGATRLTDSGLSITEWKPIVGVFPPLGIADWLIEFEKYKATPEYRQINQGMSLGQFKVIYWWEWTHRLLGRAVGLVFFLPLIWFWATGRLEAMVKPRLVLLGFLGGLQGVIGWWMVASGLVERVDVSQYRLATHLTLASLIFAYALWLARALTPHRPEIVPRAVARLAPVIVLVLFVQIFAGALVAGLDAGMAFNTWPLIDGSFIPPGLHILSPFWLNWFETPKTVQFLHRMAAYLVLVLVVVNVAMCWLGGGRRAPIRRSLLLLALALVQAALGIFTLLAQVPIHWALAHQAGAILLLGFAVAHWRAIKGGYLPVTDIRPATLEHNLKSGGRFSEKLRDKTNR